MHHSCLHVRAAPQAPRLWCPTRRGRTFHTRAAQTRHHKRVPAPSPAPRHSGHLIQEAISTKARLIRTMTGAVRAGWPFRQTAATRPNSPQTPSLMRQDARFVVSKGAAAHTTNPPATWISLAGRPSSARVQAWPRFASPIIWISSITECQAGESEGVIATYARPPSKSFYPMAWSPLHSSQ